jgi:hypothetical protein
VDVQLDFDGVTSRDRWVAGFMPMYSLAINGARPKVWMRDRDGRLTIPKTEIRFPDAYYVNIWDVTADHSGFLYAAVEAWSSGGSGTGAICKIGPGGKDVLVIRTEGFRPVGIAISGSSDIWVFGHPLALQDVRRTTTEYPTLWRFDGSGRLLDKVLPRSSFCSDCIPTHAFGDLGFPFLRANGARIGVYSATAKRWIELDSVSGAKTLDIKAEHPSATDGIRPMIGELAMTEPDGNVYAFFVYRYQDAAHTSAVYRLDKAAARWVSAYVKTPADEFGGLYGADGADLIFRAGSKTYGWVPNTALIRKP